MFKVEVIGNLGADAVVKSENGRDWVQFNVAHTDKWKSDDGTVHEQTQWVSCFINGRDTKALPYLVKGKQVFVRGDARLRTYSSEQQRGVVAGISINVREYELIGGKVEKKEEPKPGEDGKPF